MNTVSKLSLIHFGTYINTGLEFIFSTLFLCMPDANAVSMLSIAVFLKDTQHMASALCMH